MMARSIGNALGVLALALCVTASAEELTFEPDYRDFALGVHAGDMPVEEIDVYACGSNGGPPLSTLNGWGDYAECAADEKGLHEVYIELNTELQRLAESTEEQYGQAPWFKKFAGTRVANFAVVMSVLFDSNGIARGFRVVTDPRAGLQERAQAYLLALRILPEYGREGWSCVDREPGPREAPVGEFHLNRFCQKQTNGKLVTVESHLFRKAGQTGVDLSGQPVPGDYESLTIWEVYDKAFLDALE